MRKKRLVKPYQSSRVKKRKVKVELKQEAFYYLTCVAIVLVLLLVGVNINKSLTKPKPAVSPVLAQTRDVEQERTFWINILNETPTYLPGILELAKIESELGNSQAAQELLDKARLINPNDERVKQLESSY
ncbi:tetratricopeptide repeat protein [Candidatus Woesebacteria bacterium]|nr:tetratricopeptide repeat protein [Candidatus Woesebacteria bacterium]